MDMKEGKRDAFLSQSGAALKNRSLKERNRRNRAKIISKWKEFLDKLKYNLCSFAPASHICPLHPELYPS